MFSIVTFVTGHPSAILSIADLPLRSARAAIFNAAQQARDDGFLVSGGRKAGGYLLKGKGITLTMTLVPHLDGWEDLDLPLQPD